MVVLHHIVADGWSIDVFLKDLLPPTTAARQPPLPVRYGDYAAWQRARYAGDGSTRDLAYWRGQLAGVPPLDLPTDRPRPPEQRFAGAGSSLHARRRPAAGLSSSWAGARRHRCT